MATRQARRRFTVLAIAVAISVILIVTQSSLGGAVKSVGSTVLSPFAFVINGVTRPIGNFLSGALNYSSATNENAKLRAQVARLRMSQAEVAYERRQVANVLGLQNLPFLNQLPTQTAQTTGISQSNFSATITISKGSSSGIAAGMAVVGAGGYVGQVVSTSSASSLVRLVTDGQTRIGVTFGTTPVMGMLKGNGHGSPLAVAYVPFNSLVHIGETVYTNGLSGSTFPAGIPVGHVITARSLATAAQMQIVIAPDANLGNLTYVNVVLWEPLK